MRYLWSGAAAAALLLSALGGCASPHYPIDASQAPGPEPFAAPRPQYPIDMPTQDAAAAPSAEGAAMPAAATTASGDRPPASAPPSSSPVATVESQSLPPPPGAPAAPATAPSGGTLQPAAVSTEAGAPAPTAPTPTGGDAAPAPDEPALTPQTVTHDGPPLPAGHTPIVEASAAPPPAPVRTTPMAGYAASGQVVDAGGTIFENYEVQRGDHVDALARAFATSRDMLLQANDIRAPYVIRPGQIIKVPVAKAYVVVSGDTLAEVARRFSVSAGELADLNHISQYAALRPGSRLGLPSSMRDAGPVRVETSYAYNGGSHSYEPPQPHSYEPPATHGYQPSTPQAPPGHHLTEVTPAAPTLTQEHPSSSYAANPPAGATAQAAFNMSDSQLQQAAHGRFIWPVRGDILERFGPQGVGRRNDGVDIKAPQGSTVAAAAPGEVVYAGDQVPGFGNLVLIKHADGWVTAYAHLDQINVQMKQEVTQGQALGSVGASGGAPQAELHFEIRYAPTPADKAKPVDPILVLPTG